MSQEFTQTQITKKHDCQNPIFKSKEEMEKSLSRLCYGDLHTIGRIWVEGVKSALVGTKMCLVPTVEAAAAKTESSGPPCKPPKMKYKDLPLYETPHCKYKEYLSEKELKCLDDNPKLLHRAALPVVSRWRRATQGTLTDMKCFLKEAAHEVKGTVLHKKCRLLHSIRHGDTNKRRATVILGTAAAYIIAARRTPWYYQRFFWASVAAVSTGWLCFPKETDIAVREVGYNAHQFLKMLYDFWYDVQPLPCTAPCSKDMPPMPPKRKKKPEHECPPKECKNSE